MASLLKSSGTTDTAAVARYSNGKPIQKPACHPRREYFAKGKCRTALEKG
jgi:hypothetical protein